MRPEKAKELQKWHNTVFGKKTSLQMEIYEDAVILPLKRDDSYNLFGKGGVVVNQSYKDCSGIEKRVGGYYEYDSTIYRDEKVVYCGALVLHWGHFLVESVARMWYFLNNNLSVDKYIFISDRTKLASIEQLQGNYREFFRLLGVLDKLEIVQEPTMFREVIVPELGYSRKYYYSDEYIALFNTIASRAMIENKGEKDFFPDKVFLSRSKLVRAHSIECGLEMLDSYFANNGFCILYPEKLSLTELIGYLRNASVCAAESGTLPHNFLFCQDGKKVYVIERQTTINEIQANIDIIKTLDITYIDGHLTIYPGSAGYGPFFLAYNEPFKRFSYENNYLPPDQKYLTERVLKKNLQKYFKMYRKGYGYSWGIEEWQVMYSHTYYEAYDDSLKNIGPFLTREKPLFWWDYCTIRFLKASLRKMLKKH